MSDNLNNILENISEFLKNETKTETIIGKEFKLGEFSCIPVIGVGLGFGLGGGEGNDPKVGKGAGSGAAAGMGMSPVGFLVAKGDLIQFIPAKHSSGLSATFEKLPDILEKYIEREKDEKKVTSK